MGKLFVFTGAGVSVESGVPLYRGGEGLWDEYKLDQVCNYRTWKANFELVHEFYNKRRAELTTVKPNAMHEAIARWSQEYEVVNITQNVDDLFEKAGCTGVIHVHGNLTSMRCEACGFEFDVGYSAWDPKVDTCRNSAKGCICRKGIKPNVVFFNEGAPKYADLYRTIKDLTAEDVILVIGTSGEVLPIDQYLLDAKGYKILVNPKPMFWDCWDFKLHKPATEAIEEVDQVLKLKLG